MKWCENSLKIPKVQSEIVNRRKAKIQCLKGQTMIHQALHTKLKIEQWEPG